MGPHLFPARQGAEDVALIEYAHLTGRPYRVFSLDTGRLNPETYRLFDKVGCAHGWCWQAGAGTKAWQGLGSAEQGKWGGTYSRHASAAAAVDQNKKISRPSRPPLQVEKHYNIRIEYTFPDAHETMELVRQPWRPALAGGGWALGWSRRHLRRGACPRLRRRRQPDTP